MGTDKREQRIGAKRLAQPTVRAMTMLELQCRQVLARGDENDWRYPGTLRDELIAEIESGMRAQLHIDDEAGRRALSMAEKLFC